MKIKLNLFGETNEDVWQKEWKDMPEYNNVTQPDPAITALFKFRTQKDFDEFNALLKKYVYRCNKVFDGMQRKNTKNAWFPLKEKASNYRYVSDNQLQPQYPIYVISKGRWSRRQTIKTLESMKVNFRVVVEPSEYKQYASVVDKNKILVLPSDFSKQGSGSIPVRNWVWEHSIQEGHKRHWILDDNIESVERFNNNMKIKCETPTPFCVVEQFVDRYINVALAGMHYAIFCPASEARSPIVLNDRVYSCILIKNDLPHRWRGRYNEDTDLSLRVLKDGWVTVLFRQFLLGKRATMTQKGGNTDTIYNTGDNRLAFAQSLADQHPDVVKVTKKFGRWHHQVNYKPFKKNKLIRKEGLEIPDGINEYGMKLTHF